MLKRDTKHNRATKETIIEVYLNLDGKGDSEINTGNEMFDHLLAQLSKPKCIGDGKGIVRTSHSYVPLDETLVRNVIDFGGRGYFKLSGYIGDSDLGQLSGSLISHFLETFSRESKCNIFTTIIEGVNNHHISEAIFKSLGISLKKALEIDPRRTSIPSTKGTIN